MAKSNSKSRQSIRPGLETVRDRLWIWAHDPFFYDGAYGLPGKSLITPVEGAFYMGIPNVKFIRLSGKPAPPFHQYYIPFRPLKRVEWSLFDNNGQPHELGEEQEHIYRLAAEEPNLVGVVMDDFIVLPGSQADGHWLAANNVSFPVALTLSLPNPTRIDAVELTQAEWPSGDYRSRRFALDLSSEGENWQEVVTGEMPKEGGAIASVPLRGAEVKSLRLRILDTYDTTGAISCGLRCLRLLTGNDEVPLSGATIDATSSYPGHEPDHLLTKATAEVPPAATGMLTREQLAEVRQRLDNIQGRRLDLSVVVYTHQLDFRIAPLLESCDVALLWTWKPEDLMNLEANLRKLKQILSGKRVRLGCYLWDFNGGKPISLELMKKQCDLGLKWLKAGEIEGIIFLGTNVCDLDIEAVEWTREWIAEVGEEPLSLTRGGPTHLRGRSGRG